jgi:hypothetical protein
VRRLTALPVRARRPAKRPRGELLAVVGSTSLYGHVLRSLTVPRRRVPVMSARVGLSHKDDQLGWAELALRGQELRARLVLDPRSYADGMMPRLEVWPLDSSESDESGYTFLDGEAARVYLEWDDRTYRFIRPVKRHHEAREPWPRKALPRGFRKWNYPERWGGKAHVVERRRAFGLTRKQWP